MAEQVRALEKQLAGLRQQVAQRNIKAPKFNGQGSARHFLDQFEIVKEANGWGDDIAGLQLKLALEGTSRIGVVGNTYPELRQSLLSKYELSQEEARNALRSFRIRSNDDLYELGENLLHLVEVAHPDLSDAQQDQEAIFCLIEAVGDNTLRHELRMTPARSYQEALERVRNFHRDMGRGTRRLIQPVALEDPIGSLQKAISTLQVQVEELGRRQTGGESFIKKLDSKMDEYFSRGPSRPTPRMTCYGCGKPGHFQRDCRKTQGGKPSRRQGHQQGNGPSPSA